MYPSVSRRRTSGQIVPLVAIMLPFLLAFTLLVIEVAERWLEVAMIEDALQQATRSAVQQLDYRSFATNGLQLRGGEQDCIALTLAQARASGRTCAAVLEVADRFLRTNLRGVRGLAESSEALVARVRWTVRPLDGGCSYSDGRAVVSAPQPLLCAEVRPLMRGLVGWGTYTPLIIAADRPEPADTLPGT